MDKKLLKTLFVIIIVLGGVMVWSLVTGKKFEQKTLLAAKISQTTNVQKASDKEKERDVKTTEEKQVLSRSPLDKRYVRKETKFFSIDFSANGGTVRNLYLKKYHDPSGNNLNLIEVNSNADFFPFSIYFTTNKELSARSFRLQPQTQSNETVFQYLTRGDEGLPAGLVIEKKFTFEPDSYLFWVDIVIKNPNGTAVNLDKAGLDHLSFNYCTTPIGLKKNDQYNQVVMSFAKNGDMQKVNKANNFTSKKFWDLEYSNQYEWSALARRYFIVSMMANDRINLRRPDYALTHDGSYYGMTMQERLPKIIKGGSQIKVKFYVYAGPKDREIFREYKRRYKDIYGFVTFEQAMGFSKILGPISNILQDGLNFIFHLTPNYGVCIILLTLLIKLLFIPLTYKQYESMEKMKRIQPMLNSLKERYKDDQQKFNTETMAIYKKHKINPLSGCFPMLIQISVFLSFYNLLVTSIAMRDAKFLWIKDLARPDTLAWIAGLPLNIMPLLMTLTQFIYQRLTSTGDAQQQKILQFMPLIFLFIFWNLPSGLVLYWTAQNIMSIVETSIIHAHLRKKNAEKPA